MNLEILRLHYTRKDRRLTNLKKGNAREIVYGEI